MIVTIKVHPKSKNPRVEKSSNGETHIYIKEAPIKGEANKAVLKVLSDIYRVPPSSIKMLRGIRSKDKVFEINK